MKVIVYTPSYNKKHQEILANFAEGIPNAIIKDQSEYEPCDVAVIFGWYKYAYSPTMQKKAIIDKHPRDKLIVVESAFVKRGEYYQAGWGGFAGDADFRSEDSDSKRWEQIGVELKPWRKSKGPVIVCGQLPRDTQVQDVDHLKWCKTTFRAVQKLGLDVRFRPHPKVDDPAIYKIHSKYHDKSSIKDLNASCFITWNSTSSIDALIEGIPAITMNRSSMAWPITQHDIEDCLNLKYPDRTEFFNKLGYSQWTLEEMQEGLVWQHLTR